MRGCSFKYANKNSEEFNLMLFFVGSAPNELISGGSYELSTDSLPYVSEQLLYGKKYDEPLEFEVEIIDPDEAIPIDKMRKIKEWLFGQDGWKTLNLMDNDYSGYYLKCLFVPKEDIIDASGYRGIRCTLHNMSPYWYGNSVYVKKYMNKDTSDPDGLYDDPSSKKGKCLTINVRSDCDEIVLPTIRLKAKDGVDFGTFELSTVEEHIIGDGHTDNPSRKVVTSFIRVLGSGHAGEVLTIDLKHLQAHYPSYEESVSGNKTIITDFATLVPTNIPPLFFKQGDNILKIYHSDNKSDLSEYFDWIEVEYTPLIMIGGF